MPIYGLTPMLLEIGKIKIGMKGEELVSKNEKTFRKAVKIDHFRITTNERDEEDNLVLDKKLLEIIKKEGKAKYNKDGNLVSIPIQLLYNDINLTFPHELVSMVNWKRSCSGDGKSAITRDGRTVKCPCPRIEPGYEGKDKCQYSGVLSCVIDGANIGGCHKFRTKGYNSVNYILSSLTLIKTITGGLLAFLPLNLVVTSKRSVNPKTGEPITFNVVTIETRDGGQDKLQKLALSLGHERTKLIENLSIIENEAKSFLLPETEDEEKEIFEEFSPDNIIPDSVKKEPEKSISYNTSTYVDVTRDYTTIATLEGDTDADKLLGEAVKTKPEPETETKVETKVEVLEDEKITRDQLVEILNLKNKLGIKDQVQWASMIKKMKFPDVKKANDMTTSQGDNFIEYLKKLINDDIPF